MKRREFVGLVGGAAAWPVLARAQQSARVYRVALIFPNAPVSDMSGPDPASRYVRSFIHALRDYGYVEGSNLILERRSAEGDYERYADIGAELIKSKTDVIVAANNRGIELLKTATSTVPIVMAGVLDPVGSGFVASLARPGGNLTGFTFDAGSEIEAVRLQLLIEAVPSARQFCFFGTQYEWETTGPNFQAAAKRFGVALAPVELIPSRYAEAFPAIMRGDAQAVIASRNGAHAVNSQLIAHFLLAQRLPGIFYWRDIVNAGGLLSYAADFGDILRRAAGYVDRILKGAKPADLPIQQPTKYELAVNLKTAKALGIELPPSLLARADEVIE